MLCNFFRASKIKVSGYLLLVGTQAWAGYADVQTFMSQMVSEHPESAQLFELGESDSGQMIYGLEIGSGDVAHLVVATHHGNEYGSTEVAMAVAEDLAKAPIEGLKVYVIPVLNIWGYDNLVRKEKDKKGVKRDPNRDYPGPCGTDGPYHLKSTSALSKFIAEKNIVAAATLHAYAPAVVYPWGLSTQDLSTPYDAEFKEMCEIATKYSGYEVGNSSEVIYPADGTFEDYAFWEHGIWSLLFELGYQTSPSPEEVRVMIEVNVPGIRDMLVKAPRERAVNHAFEGECDEKLRKLDLRNE